MNRLLILLAACLCTVAGRYSERACADNMIRTVAVSGAVAPDAQGAMFRSFNPPQINNLGRVAFTAQQTGPGIDPPSDGITEFGVWSEGLDGGLQLVARADDPAPGTDGNIFDYLFLRDINDAGQVVVDGNLNGGSNQDQGLWILRNTSQLELLIREDSPVPWINGDYFGETDAFGPYLNEKGQVFFTQGFHDEPVTYYKRDVLEWSDGVIRSLEVTDGMDIGLSGVKASRIDYTLAGDKGHVAFAAYLLGDGVTFDNNLAFFARDLDGSLRLVAREGDALPGAATGQFFESYAFQFAAPSHQGFTTFIADLNATGTDRGIWSERSGNGLELLVMAGDPLASDPEIKLHPLQLATNDFGKVAFRGGLSGPSVTSENNTALLSDGFGTGFEVVARSGSLAPGVADAIFQELHDGVTFFNNAGQLTFKARIRGPGISAANDEGIWAQDRQGIVQLILREGMEIDVDDGSGLDLRTVSAAAPLRIHGFNDRGQIVFAARFTDGTSGIFVSNAAAVPEPTGWLQLLVLGIVFIGIQRRAPLTSRQ